MNKVFYLTRIVCNFTVQNKFNSAYELYFVIVELYNYTVWFFKRRTLNISEYLFVYKFF